MWVMDVYDNAFNLDSVKRICVEHCRDGYSLNLYDTIFQDTNKVRLFTFNNYSDAKTAYNKLMNYIARQKGAVALKEITSHYKSKDSDG